MSEIFVAKINRFPDSERRTVSHVGGEIGFFHWQGEIYAYENLCMHQGRPACEGAPCSIRRSTTPRPATAWYRSSAAKKRLRFMVTAARRRPIHHNSFMKTYALLEEMGLPLGFHAGYNWNKRSMEMMINKFISVHAIGFVFYNMVHLTDWIMNGLSERFPKLKVLWIESGLTWMP